MGGNIRGLLSAGVGGAALAWAAVTLLGDDAAETREPPEPAPAARPAELALPIEPADQTAAAVESADSRAAPRNDTVPDASTSASAARAGCNPIVIDTPPTSRGTPTDLPDRVQGDRDHARPADELLDTARISCDFGGGSNTGLRFGETLTVGGGADWQGGLIVYDLLDAGPGEARMTGSRGATGSETGETKVELRISGARLTFLGELRDGTLVVTTIYPELDNIGRHVAVMSRHEQAGMFSYAAQFLGTCQ